MADKDWLNAFEPVKAEEELKRNTKRVLHEYAASRKKQKAVMRVVTAVCVLAVFVSSFWGIESLHAEAAYITLDSVPRIGISVNLWNKVISVQGLNKEGIKVVESLHLDGLTYREAVQRILNSKLFKKYDSKKTSIEIDVNSKNDNMRNDIEEAVTDECENHLRHHRHGENEGASSGDSIDGRSGSESYGHHGEEEYIYDGTSENDEQYEPDRAEDSNSTDAYEEEDQAGYLDQEEGQGQRHHRHGGGCHGSN